jgi:hypothetical protein
VRRSIVLIAARSCRQWSGVFVDKGLMCSLGVHGRGDLDGHTKRDAVLDHVALTTTAAARGTYEDDVEGRWNAPLWTRRLFDLAASVVRARKSAARLPVLDIDPRQQLSPTVGSKPAPSTPTAPSSVGQPTPDAGRPSRRGHVRRDDRQRTRPAANARARACVDGAVIVEGSVQTVRVMSWRQSTDHPTPRELAVKSDNAEHRQTSFRGDGVEA